MHVIVYSDNSCTKHQHYIGRL